MIKLNKKYGIEYRKIEREDADFKSCFTEYELFEIEGGPESRSFKSTDYNAVIDTYIQWRTIDKFGEGDSELSVSKKVGFINNIRQQLHNARQDRPPMSVMHYSSSLSAKERNVNKHHRDLYQKVQFTEGSAICMRPYIGADGELMWETGILKDTGCADYEVYNDDIHNRKSAFAILGSLHKQFVAQLNQQAHAAWLSEGAKTQETEIG